MDIQSILSLAIQIIFMSFVSLVFVDFVNGLFWLPHSAIAPVATTNQAIAAAVTVSAPEAIAIPALQAQFAAQLPDPWFTTDIPSTAIQQEPAVLEFPTLRLLLPAAPQMQPKTRATTKSATAKKTTQTTNLAATPRSKSRKKAAA